MLRGSLTLAIALFCAPALTVALAPRRARAQESALDGARAAVRAISQWSLIAASGW